MMDNFEKYIVERKKEFNTESADKNKIWKVIEDDLTINRKKKVNQSFLFKIAASILILIGSIFFFISTTSVNSSKDQQTLSINKELKDIDAYYKVMVNSQVNLINENNSLSEKEKKEFLEFMDELDIEYEELKKEMHQNLDNERVLKAIVNNYKKRIELIENFLTQINSNQKTENDDVYVL